MPKYLRVLRSFASIFNSRLFKIFEIDDYVENVSNQDIHRMQKTAKYLAVLLFSANLMSCYIISYTYICDSEYCNNWFSSLMQDQYTYSLSTQSSEFYSLVNQYETEYGPDIGSIQFYNYILNNRRVYVYYDAWYFVLQTFTTVGYGDVGTTHTNERIFRTVCMIIGTVIYTVFSSIIIDWFMAETLNVFKQNDNEFMITKLQSKYNIKGDSRRFLNLLGDSVYTEKLEPELKFAKLLPDSMSDCVLNFIWKVYLNKLPLLREESKKFFMIMMKQASFRRCVHGEVIRTDNQTISIIYSGRVGMHVSNLKEFFSQDYLYYLGIGEEIGYANYIQIKSSTNNFIYNCTFSTELIEIPTHDYIQLLIQSLKGLDYIYVQIIDYITEMYLMVALYYSMLKMGMYIDLKIYNLLLVVLNFKQTDMNILDKLYDNITLVKSTNLNKKINQHFEGQNKWYLNILDNETYKYIINKSKSLVSSLIKRDYNILVMYVAFFKKDKNKNYFKSKSKLTNRIIE